MLKLYPAPSKRLSNRRIVALLVFAVITIGWIAYSYLANELRRENYVIQAVIVSLLVGFGIAESMWPVISFDDRIVIQHRTLWFPKQYRLEDIGELSEDGRFLYVNQPNRKVAIDLSKLDGTSLAKIQRLTRDTK